MGTDNLFHKRRAKGVKELERRRARRAPYEKVLIVTEGGKTEPFYFMGLKNFYEINNANIKIDGSSGSTPGSVVEYGRRLYQQERNTGDPFDRVYFVFDKDIHPDYQQALSKISAYSPKNTFYAINSVPCFEYWLLLHFIYTTEHFSAADVVIRKLRKQIPDYDKSAIGLFDKLNNKLETAKSNAIKALQAANQTGTDNPSTRVHELVHYLQKIKES